MYAKVKNKSLPEGSALSLILLPSNVVWQEAGIHQFSPSSQKQSFRYAQRRKLIYAVMRIVTTAVVVAVRNGRIIICY